MSFSAYRVYSRLSRVFWKFLKIGIGRDFCCPTFQLMIFLYVCQSNQNILQAIDVVPLYSPSLGSAYTREYTVPVLIHLNRNKCN
jgi:hypothetical protein